MLALDEPVSDDDSISDDDEVGYTAHKTKRHSFLKDITTFIDCLMVLIPTLERANRRKPEEISSLQQVPVNFEVTEPARIYVRHVLDRFPHAAKRLAERLGEANWQRHMEIREMMHREDVDIDPGTGFAPKSKFHDSGLGSSIPGVSTYAMSTTSGTSFASSLAEKERGTLRVPPTPHEVAKGKPFQCSFCGQVLSWIRNRRDWKYVYHKFLSETQKSHS